MERVSSVAGHLKELRARVLVCLVSVVLFTSLSYFFADDVIQMLIRPLLAVVNHSSQHQHVSAALDGWRMICMDVSEGFMVHISVALYCGVLLSVVVIILQLYLFVIPGLYGHERSIANYYIVLSLLLLVVGILFAYYVVIPLILEFFLSFGYSGAGLGGSVMPIVFQPRLSNYVEFVMKMFMLVSLSFQLPIVVSALHLFKICGVSLLEKYRRHVVVVIFIFAALVTPPDVISQIIFAVPLYFLYEFSIIICKIVDRMRRKVKD